MSASVLHPASRIALRPVSRAFLRPVSRNPRSATMGSEACVALSQGKRPLKSEDRLKPFLQGRDEHKQRLQQTPKGRKRQATDAQQHYREFVKVILPYEIDGNKKDRLTRVAAKWNNQQTMPETHARDNQSVL